MCSFIEQTGSVQQDEEDEQTNHDNDFKMIFRYKLFSDFEWVFHS